MPHHKLAIYNHKGGVGKTTLTVNIAFALAELGRKVLMVDSDPQCSLTTYLIEDSVVNDLLDNSETPTGKTMWTAVQPLVEGDGGVKLIEPIELMANSLYLMPGDIRLSAYEENLSDDFADCAKRRPKGFKAVSAIKALVDHVSDTLRVDFVFFDSGPNIGSLNKTLILDCENIIVPAACDEFSLRALKTLGNAVARWIREWEALSSLAPDGVPLLAGRPKLMGYIPQRFRVYRGQPASIFSGFMSRLENAFDGEVAQRLREIDESLANRTLSEYKIGEVKDFGQIAVNAQRLGLPMWRTGSPGSEEAQTIFKGIAQNIINYYGQ